MQFILLLLIYAQESEIVSFGKYYMISLERREDKKDEKTPVQTFIIVETGKY